MHHANDPIEIDPFGRDIPSESEKLRARGTVVPVILPGNIPAYAITTYVGLREIILNNLVSKDPRRHWTQWDQAQTRPEWAWILQWVGVTNMLTTYGTDHQRLRRLIAPTFTARRITALAPRIQFVVAKLLDQINADANTVDLKKSYAYALPMEVICDMFDVPDFMRPDFATLMNRIIDTSGGPEEASRTGFMIEQLIPEFLDYKRSHPGSDLTSQLIQIREKDGDRLNSKELEDTLILMIGAGHETTVNLIANAIHTLLTQPSQLEQVSSGTVTWDQIITETLRWTPSIANLPLRFAVEELSVDNVTIPKGSAILTTIGAANRDPTHYGPTAATFDPTRHTNGHDDHLAFGIGVHRCLGAPLARLEATIALPAIFSRFPHMTLLEDCTPVRSFIAHGPSSLPVRLRP